MFLRFFRIIFSQNPHGQALNDSASRSDIDLSNADLTSKSLPRKSHHAQQAKALKPYKAFVIKKEKVRPSEETIKNWRNLASKLLKRVPSPVESALSHWKITRVTLKRAVKVISAGYCKYKENWKAKAKESIIGNWTKSNEIQSGLETFSDSGSDLSCDLSRGEVDEEISAETQTSKRLEEVKKTIPTKPQKYFKGKLEVIPEASVRLEETLLKHNSNPFLADSSPQALHKGSKYNIKLVVDRHKFKERGLEQSKYEF